MNSDHPPEGLCLVSITGFECWKDEQLVFYVALVCLIVASGLFLLSIAPVDILLVGWAIAKFIRIVLCLMVLLNWPKSVLVRAIVNTSTLLITAITTAAFIREENFDCPSNRDLIYVPSTRAIYWTSIGFSAACILFAIGIIACLIISNDMKQKTISAIADRLLVVIVGIVSSISMLVCGYYCYGFYRIIKTYLGKNAARYFRNIFLAVLLTFFAAFVYTILIALLKNKIVETSWGQAFTALVQDVVIYPTMQCTVFYNAFMSSKAQVQRQRVRTTTSLRPESFAPVANQFSSGCDFDSGINSWNPNERTGDTTLLWYSFATRNSPASAEFIRPISRTYRTSTSIELVLYGNADNNSHLRISGQNGAIPDAHASSPP
ncbi:hypothetical protein BDF19DRAFT_439301 [Syncephalis fuscata]|nr:hypothetical protein BDF19DRAFT_439301 [Syncephalis fuscata]